MLWILDYGIRAFAITVIVLNLRGLYLSFRDDGYDNELESEITLVYLICYCIYTVITTFAK